MATIRHYTLASPYGLVFAALVRDGLDCHANQLATLVGLQTSFTNLSPRTSLSRHSDARFDFEHSHPIYTARDISNHDSTRPGHINQHAREPLSHATYCYFFAESDTYPRSFGMHGHEIYGQIDLKCTVSIA